MSRVKLAEVASQAGQTEDACASSAGRPTSWRAGPDRRVPAGGRAAAVPPARELRAGQEGRPAATSSAATPRPRWPSCRPASRSTPGHRDPASCWPTTFEQLGQGAKTISVLKELAKVYEDRRQRAERNAAIQRILAIDPADPISGSLHHAAARGPEPVAGRPARPSPTRPAAIKRDAAITFSELQVPAADRHARPSGSYTGAGCCPRPGRRWTTSSGRPRCSGSSPSPTSS